MLSSFDVFERGKPGLAELAAVFGFEPAGGLDSVFGVPPVGDVAGHCVKAAVVLKERGEDRAASGDCSEIPCAGRSRLDGFGFGPRLAPCDRLGGGSSPLG